MKGVSTHLVAAIVPCKLWLSCRKGEWQEVVIPLQDFLLTADGHATEFQPHINPTRIAALGFSLAGGRDLQSNGPFELLIGGISAGYNSQHVSFEE